MKDILIRTLDMTNRAKLFIQVLVMLVVQVQFNMHASITTKPSVIIYHTRRSVVRNGR